MVLAGTDFRFVRYYVRVQFTHRYGEVVRRVDTDMEAAELTGFPDPAGMREYADFIHHVFRVVCHPYRLVLRVQSSLELFIMRGDTGRAGVLVALQRLDATQGEHEAARRDNKISTQA